MRSVKLKKRVAKMQLKLFWNTNSIFVNYIKSFELNIY